VELWYRYLLSFKHDLILNFYMKIHCQNLKDMKCVYVFDRRCYVVSDQGVLCLNHYLLIILVLFSFSS